MLTEKSPAFTPSVKFSLINFNQLITKPEEKTKPASGAPLKRKDFLLVGQKVNRNERCLTATKSRFGKSKTSSVSAVANQLKEDAKDIENQHIETSFKDVRTSQVLSQDITVIHDE
jgi:hypothetical protein